jgi:FkbM family methyltransferase
MKKRILYIGSTSESPLKSTYVSLIYFLIKQIVALFKFGRFPGLSRVLYFLSKFPAQNYLLNVRFSDGGEFSFPVFDYYYNMFFLKERDYEIELVSLINTIEEKFFFFDGGANMGYISSSVASLSTYCEKLVAIEPNSSLHGILDFNIKKNINISNDETRTFTYIIRDEAIGNSSSKTQLFCIERHAGSGLLGFGHNSKEVVEVGMVSLNELIEKYGDSNVFNLIKLDLEGVEMVALENFNYFENSLIVFEVLNLVEHVDEIQKISKKNLLDVYVWNSKWMPFTLNEDNSNIYVRGYTDVGFNLLFVPSKLANRFKL